MRATLIDLDLSPAIDDEITHMVIWSLRLEVRARALGSRWISQAYGHRST
jgi:hypothetical protein